MNLEEYLKFCSDALKLDKGIVVMGFNSIPSYPMSEDLGTIESSSTYFKPNKGERILDIGCGYGRFLFQCEEKGLEATGIDPSKDMINLANRIKQNKNSRVIFKTGSINTIKFNDNYFDHIWVYEVTEYLSDYQLQQLLKEIRRILKPNGYLYLEFKNRLHLFSLVSEILNILLPGKIIGARNSFSVFKAQRIIRLCKFKIKSIHPESMILFPLYLPVKSGSWRRILAKGMPETQNPRFIPIFPNIIIRMFSTFFSSLKKVSQQGFKFPVCFSKEYLLKLKKNGHG